MLVLQWMKKTRDYYGTLYVGITLNVKKPTTIMGPICGYCIFENGLMEIIIKNDVGFLCLKCVYF